MARKFNGSSDFCSIPLDLSRETKVTLSMWLYWDAFANDNKLAMEYGSPMFDSGSGVGGFIIDPNAAAGFGSNFSFGIAKAATDFYWTDSYTRPSAAAWHHYLMVMDRSAPANALYIDGVAQAATGSVHSAVAFGYFPSSTLYLMSRTGGSLFGAGRMADLAIWGSSASLAGPHALALYQGDSPLGITRDRLLAYMPFEGVSPERVLASRGVFSRPLTVSGTTGINSPLGRLAQPSISPEGVADYGSLPAPVVAAVGSDYHLLRHVIGF